MLLFKIYFGNTVPSFHRCIAGFPVSAMSSPLKHALASKFRDLVPAHKLLFELKPPPTAGGSPVLHLSNAPLREHLDDAGWHARITECHPQATFSRSGASFPLDKAAVYAEALRRGAEVDDHQSPSPAAEQTVLVEFSSPNIAKPFHVGHLRSTIIGNFAANILGRRRRRHAVHRLNYLGDWGTQFGYLQLGVQMSAAADGAEETAAAMRRDPIQHLFAAYVRAHRASATDDSVAERARAIFCQLELGADGADDIGIGSEADAQHWTEYRRLTVDELRRTYARLGVAFDEYGWESDYRKSRIGDVLERMHASGVLQPDAECAFVAHLELAGAKSAAKQQQTTTARRVPLIKSDGTTMYLTRDCAAMADRAQRLRFDRLLYVVDNGQSDHFRALFEIARRMRVPGVEGAEHVKFGRILGMSTRAGSVVFLRDILDEARDRMWERQRMAKTTRVDVSDSAAGGNEAARSTADTLGISAVIVNDLKQRRQRDYAFDWDKALQMTGDTGVKLQYTHCRLCSLAEACGEFVGASVEREPPQPRVELLREPEAEQLLFEMARYEEVLARSEEQLEACVLVVYLFGLSNAISRALSRLPVKDHPDEAVRAQRYLLFSRTREILHDGMRIVGLKPLQRM